jgi:hypothetical protein
MIEKLIYFAFARELSRLPIRDFKEVQAIVKDNLSIINIPRTFEGLDFEAKLRDAFSPIHVINPRFWQTKLRRRFCFYWSSPKISVKTETV